MSRWALDTRPEAEAILIREAGAMTPEAKMLQVAALIRLTRELAMAGLQMRYPQASPEELRRRLAALVLDAGTVRRAYGWDGRQERR